MARSTYLVGYDVSCPRRLRQTLHAVKQWRMAGQKSVAECFLSTAERDSLGQEIGAIIDQGADRLHMIRLDPRMRPELFGVARAGALPFLVV